MPVLSLCNFEEFYNFQDDDVAAVKEGSLSIHRLRRSLDDSHSREIITLKMEIQQIMKGIAALWNAKHRSNLTH
jgi:glucosamine 6-phosphate synthetase-like amidotransferase/phosphosugar isomerase protein